MPTFDAVRCKFPHSTLAAGGSDPGMGTAAPAMMPTEDLEAAIAELPAKKDALREAFDCLAACSPYPLPFTWEGLDAHVSSVQSSISRRFSQLRALEAARPARTSKNKEGANEAGEEEGEGVDEEEEVGEEEEEEEEVEEEEEEADKQMQEADGNIGNQTKEDKGGGEDNKLDADEEAVTTKVSAGQGKEAEGEELDGYAQGDGEEQDTEEEEMVEKMTKKQLIRGLTAGGKKEFAEACERMDAGTLVEFVIGVSGTFNKKLLFGLRHAPDPAALVLQVVRLLLSSKYFKGPKVWGKCMRFFRWLSMNSAKHSADTTEQAKLVAKDWKEMIGKPECYEELDSLAKGLLQFLISYNIVSEFNIHEIISIFAMLPRKGQKKNAFIVKLCEDLGLADRATDLIDYMVGNGQHLEAFNFVQLFNLEDKYPPFSFLKGYIEKAKQTSVEIFRKNETHKSLNLAIKELWIARQLAEQKLADSRQRGAIVAEIKYLMTGYEKKQRSANSSTLSTCDSQHQSTKRKRKNKKRKKEEQEHHEAQVNQQQQAQNENKLIQGKQNQLHRLENKAQVTEQQQQHMEPPRPATVKLPTPAVPLFLNVAQIQNFGRPPYAAMPGVHNYPAHPGWPVGQGIPHFGSPQYMGLPFNRFALQPPSYPR